MANNLIQIKRSLATAITNTTPSVSSGELVFTSNGYILAIGDPANSANVIAIGGARYPGTLTANQALVANATSGIDKIITANLTLNAYSVDTITNFSNLVALGTASNTELATTYAIKNFVDLKIASASNPQGSNGQFQYNNDGVLAGTTNMIYDNSSNTISIGNSSVNVQLGFTGSANQLAHFHGAQNGYVQTVMSNANNGTRASADFVAQNDLGSESGNYIDLGINSSTYNDPAYSAMGAGDSYLYAANNDLAIGTADTGELRFFTGGTTTAQIRATIDAGGNVGIGNTAPNAKLQVTGTANISGITTITANLVLGAALSANGGTGSAGHVLTSGAGTNAYWAALPTSVAGSNTQIQFNDMGSLAGDADFTFNKDTNSINVGNNINSYSLSVGSTVTVNSSLANITSTNTDITGYLTTANATLANIKVRSGNLISGSYDRNILDMGVGFALHGGNYGVSIYSSNNGTDTYAWYFDPDTGAIAPNANGTMDFGTSANNYRNAWFANSVNVGNTTVNPTSITVGANAAVNTTTLKIGNTILTTTNAVFGGTIAANGSVGTNGYVLISGGAANASWSNSLGVFSFTDVTVSGNLTVLGDLVSLNVSTLAVEDPLIALAKNQSTTSTYTDAVDIGFYGTYGNTDVANKNWTGFFRDQSDSGVYKLFSGNIPEPTTTVDTTNTNFTYATFQAQLKTGGAGAAGFISNATHIAITANSTLNVAIVANTLSLSTALPVTSGGIGLNSVAVGDLLVGNSTNTLSRLASGTDGYVLQINGTGVVAWNTLDGGTF